jgi:hypothetical protein
MTVETENLVIEFFIGRFKESGRLMERGKIVRLKLGESGRLMERGKIVRLKLGESGRLMERGKIVRLRLGKGKIELVACHHQFSGFGVR